MATPPTLDAFDGPTLSRPHATRAYVLIAETGAEFAELLASIVLTHSLTPVVVRDGDAAIAAFAEHGLPALAIVNLSLPKADGFSVLAALRYQAPAAAIPAVAMSSVAALRYKAEELLELLGIVRVLSLPLAAEAIDLELAAVLAGTWRSRAKTKLVSRDPSVQTAAEPAATARPAPARESGRLAEIERLALVDDLPPPWRVQVLLESIAHQFGVSTALVSIVTRDRQFFKAYFGLQGELLEQRGTPRELSFCRHVVEADRHEPLVVPDAVASPVFASHPLVTGGAIGSYVGVPLVSPRGHVVGTLCLVDSGAWLGSPDLVDALVAHARTVGELLWPDGWPPGLGRIERVRIPAQSARPRTLVLRVASAR